MTMLIEAFRNFANAPKYESSSCTVTAPRNNKYPGREFLGTDEDVSKDFSYAICHRVHFDKSIYELPSFPQLTKSLRHSYIVDK